MDASARMIREREAHSARMLAQLRERLAQLGELHWFPSMTVFAAGSFARLEASEYSDIDLFFLSSGHKSDLLKPHTTELRLFGQVIDMVEALELPAFSNDCEYLKILRTPDILENLGGPTDDHENYFTARMLLLLEGHCLYGDDEFEVVLRELIDSYFHDFPNHRDSWIPTFLLNDICRFWKTMLLNYEHKSPSKRLYESGDDEVRPGLSSEESNPKARRSVRNFKLKYSRLTTCFATIAALGSFPDKVVEPEDVIALTQLTPKQRLLSVAERMPVVQPEVSDVLDRLTPFLRLTGLTPAELHAEFATRDQRRGHFIEATKYGDAMHRLIEAIDENNPRIPLVRYLVI